MMLEIIRAIITNRLRMRRLQKKVLIAYEALKKLSDPLCGEWHADIASKALEDMKNES